MALPDAQRESGIAEIGRWLAEHAQSGKIVEGHRLGRGTKLSRSRSAGRPEASSRYGPSPNKPPARALRCDLSGRYGCVGAVGDTVFTIARRATAIAAAMAPVSAATRITFGVATSS